MAGKVSVECPACAAKLSLSDEKLGKKVRCPKCAEVFLAESQEEDFDDDLDDEPKPSSRNKRPATGGRGSAKGSKQGAKKGSSKEGGSSLPLIIGGSIALVVLAGAGLFLSGALNSKPLPAPPSTPMPMAAMPVPLTPAPPTPPPSQPVEAAPITPAEKILSLRWMPTETDLLVHAKLADILQAPLLNGPLGNPLAMMGLQDFEKQFGIAAADIESVSIGFVDLLQTLINSKEKSLQTDSAVATGPPNPLRQFQDIHYVAVVRLKKPIDLKAISQAIPNSTLQEKNGKSYFEVPASLPLITAFGGWLPDAQTLILATPKELLTTIEQGEGTISKKTFSDIDPQPQLVIAGFLLHVNSDVTAQSPSTQELPAIVSEARSKYEQYGIRRGSLGLTVKGGFDLQLSTVSDTADGAQKYKTQLETDLGQFRVEFDENKETAPPMIAEIGDLLLSSLKIENQNSTVKVSMGIPDSAQQKLEQLPAILMMMGMTGDIGSVAGGPGGGPNLGMGLGGLSGNSPFGDVESGALSGETEAVSATSVEGLPAGLTLTAKSAWSKSTAAPSADDKVPDVIEILIDVQGEGLEAICAATGATSKTVTAQGGGSLKRSKRVPPAGIDAQKTFLPFDVDNSLPSEHPPMTLRVRLAIDAPAKMPSKIDVLEGSFKYLTAESTKELTIENVPQRAKTPLNEPDFKAVGLKMIRGPKDVVPQTIKLQCAKEHFLGKVEGMPGEVTSVTEVEKGATIERLYSNHTDGKFPDEFEVGFKLYSNVKEQTVTFRFENVPLPTEVSKPGVSQQSATLPQQQ